MHRRRKKKNREWKGDEEKEIEEDRVRKGKRETWRGRQSNIK